MFVRRRLRVHHVRVRSGLARAGSMGPSGWWRRLSELLALTWANVGIDNVDDAGIEFAHQVDRHGNLAPTKTDGSARTIPVLPQLARPLVEHRLLHEGRSDSRHGS